MYSRRKRKRQEDAEQNSEWYYSFPFVKTLLKPLALSRKRPKQYTDRFRWWLNVNGAQDNTFSCRKPRGWVTHVASGLASCVSLSKKPSFIWFFSRHSTLVKTTLCLIHCYTFCLKKSFRLSKKLFTLTLLLKLFYLTNFFRLFQINPRKQFSLLIFKIP